MPNDADNAALIARVRKLMALANDAGATEAEASAAAAKVQEILANHNLSMAQVSGSTHDGKPDTGKREKTAHKAAAMYLYQRRLMETLAHNNFCMYWLDQVWRDDPRGKSHYDPERGDWFNMRRVKAHVLVGRDVNVQVTRLTYDYLVETMDRILPYTGMEKRGKEALLWLDGCSERLIDRLNRRRREMEEESRRAANEQQVRQRHPGAAQEPGTALVVLTDVYGSEEELNNDFRHGWEPGTTAQNRREREAAGRAYAEQIKQKTAELMAADPTLVEELARLLARGWDREEAEIYLNLRPDPNKKEETEAQRRRRAEKEERERQRWQEQYTRRVRREMERRSHPAFRAGEAAGDEIGLDPQVGQGKRDKLGHG